ncbi:cardiolipin synthase [Dysosmobacter acutus]|nr:cardiolipin synthase [Dysosmobacter acutus]
MKKHDIIVSKIIYIALFVTIQLAILIFMFIYFWDKFAYFYFFCILLSIVATVHILNSDSNPSFKIAWLIPILLLPIFGGLLYLLFGKYRFTKREKQTSAAIQRQWRKAGTAVPNAMEQLEQESPEAALHARYILRASGTPPFDHTQTEYFPIGEAMYAAMLRELESAGKFIFLEYFIVEEGVMWDGILDILERKVRQGVDVRVMYDDLGCLFTLPHGYVKTLRQKGIRACVFNPFNSILSPRFNNRDHRKICVIDGNVGFTGGINLADEYINEFPKYGHWKDTALLLRGQGVWSLTTLFLSIWDMTTGDQDDFARYQPTLAPEDVPSDGYVQPYADMPMDSELVGESVYLNIISRAREYIYITTPYLILDNETLSALKLAARSGVDVRIITPHIPDKKLVFFLTRSYYEPLQKAGVRIYEYTPGFMHAKTFVSDDQYGVVGTINLDYRSLYLHLECASWLYRSSAVEKIKQDFLLTLSSCQEVGSFGPLSLPKRLFLSVLRAFAPLV